MKYERFRNTIILLVIGFAVAAMSSSCWARAGGGGGFSGGGGGFGGGGFGGGGFSGGGISFGSGSSGGGSASQAEIIVFLIVVALVVAFKVYQMIYEPESHEDVGPARPYSRTSFLSAQRIMQHRDPTFESDIFLTRFAHAFLKIQQAWQAQDIDQVRHFVSDHLYERFSLQIQEQREFGYRDQMSDIQLKDYQLAEADPNSVFDVLTVCVTASLIDVRVSIQDGSYISGNKRPTTFTEFWSFVRRQGVSSGDRDGGGLMEGFCPSCGDAMQMNQIGQCESCGAVSRGGEYDWVLAEITQASVWKPVDRQQQQVYAWYVRSRDPGFNIQHLEDRASVIFFRKVMSDRIGNIKALTKVALPEFSERYGKQISQIVSTQGPFEGNCSVGSVDLVGLIPRDDHDLALVEVHYSCHTFRRKDGKLVDEQGWRRRKTLLVLYRKKTATTDISKSIASASCPSCGAPEMDLTSDACGYCGEVTNGGQRDWVLKAIYSPLQPEARDLRNEALEIQRRHAAADSLLASQGAEVVTLDQVVDAQTQVPPTSRMDGLCWYAKTAAADGEISDRERRFLNQFAEKSGVPNHAVEEMISQALDGTLATAEPVDRRMAKQWIGDIAQVAMLDGKIADEEKSVLKELGRRVGFTNSDINLVLAKRRAAVHRSKRQQNS